MGIRGLNYYISSKIPQSMIKINILDEIDNYKRSNQKLVIMIKYFFILLL